MVIRMDIKHVSLRGSVYHFRRPFLRSAFNRSIDAKSIQSLKPGNSLQAGIKAKKTAAE